MPRALRVCSIKGCSELTRQGKCDECRRRANSDRARVTGTRYNARWRAFAHTWLRRYPLCFMCGGTAVHVDHIDGLGPDGPRGYDPANLQSLCRPCHSKKTVAQDGGFGRYYAD